MAKTVGDKMRHLLALRDMKQADLVRLTGISKATISDLINNKQTTTTLDTIERVAKALRVSPAFFLEESAATPFEVIAHLPESLQKFILNAENMDYLVLAHDLKERELPPDVAETIIKTYEGLIDDLRKKSK